MVNRFCLSALIGQALWLMISILNIRLASNSCLNFNAFAFWGIKTHKRVHFIETISQFAKQLRNVSFSRTFYRFFRAEGNKCIFIHFFISSQRMHQSWPGTSIYRLKLRPRQMSRTFFFVAKSTLSSNFTFKSTLIVRLDVFAQFVCLFIFCCDGNKLH